MKKMYKAEWVGNGCIEFRVGYLVDAPPGEDGQWILVKSKAIKSAGEDCFTWFLARGHGWHETVEEAGKRLIDDEVKRHERELAFINGNIKAAKAAKGAA